MRVVCVQPAREPVACGDGPIRIGSAPNDDIVLTGSGIERHHATVQLDSRGLVLSISPGCPRVYVNARAVRERALLHLGDTLTVGSAKLRVTADAAPDAGTGPSADLDDEPRVPVALRIVSGHESGQALLVQPELRLGAGTRHFGELSYGCVIERTDSGLLFTSSGAQARVNGWHCTRAMLGHGDQITLGEHRLLVEAPALQYAARLALLPPPPPLPAQDAPAPESAGAPSSQVGVWGLILAAAVLAAIIAAILYFPR